LMVLISTGVNDCVGRKKTMSFTSLGIDVRLPALVLIVDTVYPWPVIAGVAERAVPEVEPYRLAGRAGARGRVRHEVAHQNRVARIGRECGVLEQANVIEHNQVAAGGRPERNLNGCGVALDAFRERDDLRAAV